MLPSPHPSLIHAALAPSLTLLYVQVKCVFNHQLLHGEEIVLGIVSGGSGAY